MSESESKTESAWQPTACILCECNCGIEVQLGGADGRHFQRVRGDKKHPASQGYACEKPSRLDHYQNGIDRLRKPLRRRDDGTFEEVEWDTAVREVAERLMAVRDEHGGETIFYYGGGGQGNHLPGGYSRSIRSALGSRYRSNALAQEKTGEFWVSARMTGAVTRADFEHCEVAFFIGKNPWFSHGIPRARVTLREIAKDPDRCMIVVDPRRSETADMADIHLQVKPGTDAWLLSAIVAVLVQEDLVAKEWLDEHTEGREDVLPHFQSIDVARYSELCGVPEEQIREAARRVGRAESTAIFEDLGVQMNRHSTLVSYLHRLIGFGTGNFGKKGAAYAPASLQPLASGGSESGGGRSKRSPVTGSRIISGLTPCNVISEEILTDHPDRFRAMIVESGNPVHSLADTERMREALRALDFVVVIDVAMTETAREADYVLPVATQYEKAEATFFNFEFPHNYFHLRRPLLEPPDGLFSEAELHARLIEAMGLMPEDAVAALRAAWDEGRPAFRAKFFELMAQSKDFFAMSPVILFRAIGDKLPHRLAEGAVVWALSQIAAQRSPGSLRRAGFDAPDEELGDQLFDAVLDGAHGFVFSVDEWEESWKRVATPEGRIQLAVPEMLEELERMKAEPPPDRDPDYPFVLSAGERRSFTANTIFRDPRWRKKDAEGALRIAPGDARGLGIADGDTVRLSTRRGAAEVRVEVSDRMAPGHVSLPNGMGLDSGEDQRRTGVAPNELTDRSLRDPFAGTPWHKYVPARIEVIAAG